MNLEVCRNKDCKKQYLRDFDVTIPHEDVHDHRTGRKCESCGELLYDSIINFGENLPKRELKEGFEHGGKSDLCLVLGSSLRVTPAANMPEETAKNGGKLVIVNLQATPLDKYALKINAMIDDVMVKLMKKLNLEIPPFTLTRRMIILKTRKDPRNNKEIKPSLFIRGVDETGAPYQLFKSVEINLPATKENVIAKKEPILASSNMTDFSTGLLELTLEFHSHYGEPDYKMSVDLGKIKYEDPLYFLMEYDPISGEWIRFEKTII